MSARRGLGWAAAGGERTRAGRSGAARGLGLAAAGVAGAGLAGLSWALFEARWFALREFDVPVLEPGSEDLRILHISDLHFLPSQEAKRRWVRRLVYYDPHLIINTGDNMAHADALPGVLDALAPFLVRPGAFVMGSNDYYGPKPKNPAKYLFGATNFSPGHHHAHDLPGDELAEAFADSGWHDLNNARARLNVAGQEIELVGTGDAHIERDSYPTRTDEVRSGAAVHPTLRLGVTHAPYARVLQAMRDDGVDLVLAGHTHGGQLAVPGFGALVTNCDLDVGRAKGLHGWPGLRPDEPGGENSMWLHVSAGLGTSPYTPVRFACRPEATVLTLKARDS